MTVVPSVAVAERPFLSIGEVLHLLQGEFPDVTISKLRFLESQGLISPQRTEAGYRKYYDEDVGRLRWILTQQKKNFLPLKVIKEKLQSDPPDFSILATDDELPAASAVAKRATDRQVLGPAASGASFSFEELVKAAGLSEQEVKDLVKLGMIAARTVGESAVFDEEALAVTRLAASFRTHGVEPRHLRMYKVAAEREAGVYEQLVVPMLKQRDPAARVTAREHLEELARLGESMRACMLRQVLRPHLGE